MRPFISEASFFLKLEEDETENFMSQKVFEPRLREWLLCVIFEKIPSTKIDLSQSFQETSRAQVPWTRDKCDQGFKAVCFMPVQRLEVRGFITAAWKSENLYQQQPVFISENDSKRFNRADFAHACRCSLPLRLLRRVHASQALRLSSSRGSTAS